MGGEEVHVVPVEVSAGSVVVLGRAWVGVTGEDLGVAEGYPGVQCVGDGCMALRMGLMWRGMPAALAMRWTIRYASRLSIGLPVSGRKTRYPDVRSPRHASRTRRTGTVSGIVAGLFPLPTRRRTRCPRSDSR